MNALALKASLLVSGIASSVLYAAMLVAAPTAWPGYSSISRTVSELSAIGAPSASLWVSTGRVWTVLYVAFGIGVWWSAGTRRPLRVSGCLLVVAGVIGAFWPPMHRREVLAAGGGTLTDTLHLAWAAGNGVLTLLAMGFAAAALGKGFRLYSAVTMAILLAAGLLTAMEGPRVQANLPSPWVGVWERVNIGAWLLWIVVLATALLRPTPLVAFYGLTFAISWGGFILAGGPGFFTGTGWESDPRFLPAVLALVAGPLAAGLVMTGVVSGREGYREVFARLRTWRADWRWYAVALLTAPLLHAALLFLLALFSADFLPAIVTSPERAVLVAAGLGVGLVGGLMEETGWTGFALPRWRRRWGVVPTGVFVGLLWTAWHLPQMVWVGRASFNGVPLPLFLTLFVGSAAAGLTGYRVLMVEVYERTGSLLVAVLMHTSYIASTLFILAPPTTGVLFLVYAWCWAAVLWLALWILCPPRPGVR